MVMREDIGNLWTYPADAIVITTNGFVKKNGCCVMGRGSAREAAEREPWLPFWLGIAIKQDGNVPFYFPAISVWTLPVKHNWWEKADLSLIESSAKDLVRQIEYVTPNFESYVMGHPGCGNGQLNWEDVKPVLDEILDNRFIAITYG